MPTETLLSRDMRAEWWAGGVSARDKSRARSAYGSPFVIRITEGMASQFKNGKWLGHLVPQRISFLKLECRERHYPVVSRTTPLTGWLMTTRCHSQIVSRDGTFRALPFRRVPGSVNSTFGQRAQSQERRLVVLALRHALIRSTMCSHSRSTSNGIVRDSSHRGCLEFTSKRFGAWCRHRSRLIKDRTCSVRKPLPGPA